jgi:hypothetical protein
MTCAQSQPPPCPPLLRRFLIASSSRLYRGQPPGRLPFQGHAVAVAAAILPFSPAVLELFRRPRLTVAATFPRVHTDRFEKRFETFSGATPPLAVRFLEKCGQNVALYGGYRGLTAP